MSMNKMPINYILKMLELNEISLNDVQDHPKFDLIRRRCELLNIKHEDISSLSVQDTIKTGVNKEQFFAMEANKKLKEYVDEKLPTIISEEVLFTLSQADLQAALDSHNREEGGCYITVDKFPIEDGKNYYMTLNGKEYQPNFIYTKEPYTELYFDYSVDDSEDKTLISFYGNYVNNNWDEDENKILIEICYNIDINTDLSIITREVKALDNRVLDRDLVIEHSLSMNRNGSIGDFSTALGYGCQANNAYSYAEGNCTIASASCSHAEGRETTASGHAAHSEGFRTQATGQYTHAEGDQTEANGHAAHAEGYKSYARQMYTHAEGYETRAIGNVSHSEGFGTIAQGRYQHAQGKYNVSDTSNKYAHIVGNGTADNARSNAHTLDWDGNAWFAGNVTVGEDNKELTTKEYVDDKTEILPVKNNYVIFEDAIPVSTEAASTYGAGGGGNINNFNIFDNLQNTDMIVRATKFNLTISFNDGTEDITENIIVDADEQIGFLGFVNDFYISLTYDANYNLIEILVVKKIETDSGWEQTFYTITKATFICSTYSNLLKNAAIESIKYKKITQVPEKLSGLNTGAYKSLDAKQYVHLYDNSFVWDMNKINERLDETSGVTENTTATTVGGRVIKVNQKDSEGIGFGQLVPINNKHPLEIFLKAGEDVIVKVYNPNTKELISTINSDIRDSFSYTESGLPTYYLTGLDNIFVAFTIKDNTTENSTNRFIHDLVVTDSKSFLKKEEILTKANTKEYVPTEDYNPATKKYVDDNKFSGDYNDLSNKPFLNLPKHSDSTEAFYIVDVKELVVGCKYIITEIPTTNIKFRYYYDESNYKAIAIVTGAVKNIIEVYASAVTETKVQFYVDNILYTVDNIDSSAKTSTVTKTAISLKTDNTITYTPTNNYHPATKKYVDDLVNNSKEDLTEEDIDTILSDIFGTIE